MADDSNPAEKKIFVDEDWKSRVDAEREAARQGPSSQPEAAQQESEGALPEPSLTFLVSGLYLQGMVALGLLPDPASDQPEKNIPLARHTIDMLDMLRQKTEGNRTPEETREFDTILHELRMAFIAVDSPS